MRMLFPCVLFCASASVQAQGTKQRCLDTPIDSTNPSLPVYQECHVERKAKLRLSSQRPQFTLPSGGAGPTCYRASFEFVVDTSGQPELETARRVSSTDERFADAVAATLGGLRFEPARLDKAPVRQVARYESRLGVRVVVKSATPTTGGQPGARSAPLTPRPPSC